MSADQLTPREIDVLRLVAEGCTNRQIARRLDVTEDTVQTYLVRAGKRLGVTARAAMVAVALRAGVIE